MPTRTPPNAPAKKPVLAASQAAAESSTLPMTAPDCEYNVTGADGRGGILGGGSRGGGADGES